LHDELVGGAVAECLGDVGPERQVTSDVGCHLDAVHEHAAALVDGAEVQDRAVTRLRRPLERAPVVQRLVGLQLTVHPGCRGLRRERHEDAGVPPGGRGADRRDGVVPPPVEDREVLATQLRARVLRQRNRRLAHRAPRSTRARTSAITGTNTSTTAAAMNISGPGTGFTTPRSTYVCPAPEITHAPMKGPTIIGTMIAVTMRSPCTMPASPSGVSSRTVAETEATASIMPPRARDAATITVTMSRAKNITTSPSAKSPVAGSSIRRLPTRSMTRPPRMLMSDAAMSDAPSTMAYDSICSQRCR